MLNNIFKGMPVCMLKTILVVSVSAAFCGCAKTDKVITFGTDRVDAGDYAYLSESDMDPDEGNTEGDSKDKQGPESLKEPEKDETVYVHVCGAVNTPGVYSLKTGSRAADALEAAGGFAQEADKDKINLAAFISDGQQLYFPRIGEETKAYEEAGDLVNINSADISELCTVPGIGKSKAEAIIEYRNNNGRFSNPEDIMNVSGIGQGVYEKIKAHICVN